MRPLRLLVQHLYTLQNLSHQLLFGKWHRRSKDRSRRKDGEGAEPSFAEEIVECRDCRFQRENLLCLLVSALALVIIVGIYAYELSGLHESSVDKHFP